MEDEVKDDGRFARVKRHLKENKKTYLVGAGCFATGYILRGYTLRVVSEVAAPTFNNVVAPVMNNVVHNTVNNGGHCTKLVKRMSDGALFETVTDAADAAGCSVAKMSRHLNGHSPHVYEEIYKIVGLGTTG